MSVISVEINRELPDLSESGDLYGVSERPLFGLSVGVQRSCPNRPLREI